MIDIHSHLLPAVDDGADDIEETIALAMAATEAGTEIMVATPHTLNGVYRNSRPNILRQVKSVGEIIGEKKIPLKILPGADVALTPELIPCLESGDLMTINDAGKYILVELPPYYDPEKIHKIIFHLQVNGITPIITHPERDALILKNPDILRALIDRGCLSQITAMSITGGFGRTVEVFSKRLIECSLVHIIASDCHSIDKRGPSMQGAYQIVSALSGYENAQNMAVHRPQAVVDGAAIDIPPYKSVNKKRSGWFWRKFIDR
ncbi:MAG: tyrosine protein phosphatase [Deltaproteobacteria bacterium]|nr:tyrosine protein phosphatase [Deltaproteobacteria bacterium]